jgi:hypothetical protein
MSVKGNDEQTEVLQTLKRQLLNLRVKGKKIMLPFQEGWIISIKSTLQLFDHLQSAYKVSYMFTHRLSQDVLESTFSQIRGLGNFYDHPTPAEFDNRVRLLFFGNVRLQNRFSPVCASADNSCAPLCSLLKKQPTSFALPSSFSHQEETCKLCLKEATAIDIGMGEMYKEGLCYFAGYLAFKHLKSYPDLGERTSLVNVALLPKWLSAVSKGGLINPSERLLSAVKDFEEEFFAFNGSRDIHTCCNSLDKLVERIRKRGSSETIPLDVIQSYAKCRSIIRMRFLAQSITVVGPTTARKTRKKIRRIVK